VTDKVDDQPVVHGVLVKGEVGTEDNVAYDLRYMARPAGKNRRERVSSRVLKLKDASMRKGNKEDYDSQVRRQERMEWIERTWWVLIDLES
jgi:hypothetical protein